jgi:hypothetical protein
MPKHAGKHKCAHCTAVVSREPLLKFSHEVCSADDYSGPPTATSKRKARHSQLLRLHSREHPLQTEKYQLLQQPLPNSQPRPHLPAIEGQQGQRPHAVVEFAYSEMPFQNFQGRPLTLGCNLLLSNIQGRQ